MFKMKLIKLSVLQILNLYRKKMMFYDESILIQISTKTGWYTVPACFNKQKILQNHAEKYILVIVLLI